MTRFAVSTFTSLALSRSNSARYAPTSIPHQKPQNPRPGKHQGNG